MPETATRLYWLGQSINIKFKFEYQPTNAKLGMPVPSTEGITSTAIVYDSESRKLSDELSTYKDGDYTALDIPPNVIQKMGTYVVVFDVSENDAHRTIPVPFVVADRSLIDQTEGMPTNDLDEESDDHEIDQAIMQTISMLRDSLVEATDAFEIALNSARIKTGKVTIQ